MEWVNVTEANVGLFTPPNIYILYNEHLWVDKFQKVNPLIEDTVDNKDS